MRSGPPGWYDEWRPVHAALDALGKAGRADGRDEVRWLREFGNRGGWLQVDESIDRVRQAASAALEAIDDLREGVGDAPNIEDPGEAVVVTWHLRASAGLSTAEVAARLRKSESWVKERTGNRRTVEGAWPAIRQLMATVKVAVQGALTEALSDENNAEIRYLLGRLTTDARLLAETLANLAPNQDLRKVFDYLAENWHAAFPPLQPILEDDGRLTNARIALIRSKLIHRRADRSLVLDEGTASAIRRATSPDTREDLVDQLARLLRHILDEDSPRPATWPAWEVFAPHVPVVCFAALELDTAVEEALLLLNDLSGYLTARHEEEQAVEMSRRALAESHRVFPSDHPTVGAMEYRLAQALNRLDEPQEALVHADRSVQIQEQQFGDGLRLAAALDGRAAVLRSLGRHKAARLDRLRALEMVDAFVSDTDDDDEEVLETRVELLLGLALVYEDEKKWRKAQEFYELVAGIDDGQYLAPEAELNYGLLLVQRKQFDKALAVLLSAEQRLGERYPRLHWRTWQVQDALGAAYEAVGDKTNSQRHRSEAVAINKAYIKKQERESAASGI